MVKLMRMRTKTMMRMKKWRTKLRLNIYDGTMPHSSPNEVSDSDATNTVAPLSAVWAVDATTIRESALTPDAFAEQGRQEQLEADFNAFINDAVLLPGSIPDDFAPADDWVPVFDNAL